MIRVSDLKNYDQELAAEELLTIVFAIIAHEKASELRFDYRPESNELRLWYWVRDELCEMVPPPPSTWPGLVRFLLKETKPATHQLHSKSKGIGSKQTFPDFPLAGVLPVRIGRKVSNFDILFFRGRTGEHIWIEKALGGAGSKASKGPVPKRNAKRKPTR